MKIKRSRLFESALRETRDVTGLRWSELTDDEERKFALERFGGDDGIGELFDIGVMEDYKNRLDEIISEAKRSGVEFDPKKIRWENSSQGWYFSDAGYYNYPRPSFEEVNDRNGDEAKIGDVAYDYTSGGFRYFTTVEGEYYDDASDEWAEFEIDVGHDGKIRKIYGAEISQEIRMKLESQLVAASAALDEIIRLIRDTCSAYPDEDWIKDAAEVNDWKIPDKRRYYGDYDDFDDYYDDDLDDYGD